MSSGNKKPKFLTIVLSVLAAAVGVQKRQNLEQDFASSSPLPYIVAGVIFTVLFVFTLVLIVSLVIAP